MSHKLLDATTTTGAGSAVKLSSRPYRFTIQTEETGSPTTVTVAIEGSIDGTNYVELASHTTVDTNDMFHIYNKPIKYVRANLTALSGGTSPTVTVRLTAHEDHR